MAINFVDKKTHWQAEELRLRMGFDGCGCETCQEYYQKADLTRFGNRVREFRGMIIITAGDTGADLSASKNNPTEKEKNATKKRKKRDKVVLDTNFTHSEQPLLASNNVSKIKSVELPAPNFDTPKKGPGRPRKPEGKGSRTTLYRQRKRQQERLF